MSKKMYNKFKQMLSIAYTMDNGLFLGEELNAMYRAIDIAKYIVTKCTRDDYPISNLQLQKILYYIQREFLRIHSKAFDDRIEAWQFGPVIPTVYYRFSGYGAMPIVQEYSVPDIVDRDREIIDSIIEQKRVLAPWDLVEDTHAPNGAWDQTYRRCHKGVIDDRLIETVG